MTESEPTQSSEPLRRVAIHEAGHAVMAMIHGRSIERLSIVANRIRLGQVKVEKHKRRGSEDVLENEMLIFLSGLAAEAIHSGAYEWDGAQDDLRHVRRLSMQRAGNLERAERLERRLLERAESILAHPDHWLALQAIADQLLVAQNLSGRAAQQIFDRFQ